MAPRIESLERLAKKGKHRMGPPLSDFDAYVNQCVHDAMKLTGKAFLDVFSLGLYPLSKYLYRRCRNWNARRRAYREYRDWNARRRALRRI